MEEINENKWYLEIKGSLTKIEHYLDKDIKNLSKKLTRKDEEIEEYKEQLKNVEHSIEGTRQLINKLLGDLSKLQNDIDWYKRTYEQRSFLGTIREKIFRRKFKSQNS